MDLTQLQQLREQLNSSPADVTDEQLNDAVTAIREQVEEARSATPTAELIATLEELKGIRENVVTVQADRAAQVAQVNAEAERLLADLNESEAPAETENEPVAETETVTDENVETPAVDERTPELVAASGAIADAIARGIDKAFAARNPQTLSEQPAAPQGRTGRPGSVLPAQVAGRDAVTMRVRAAGSTGKHQHGQEIGSTIELGRAFSDRLRGTAGRGGNGERVFVANVVSEYPENRMLRPDDIDGNYNKVESVVSPTALVAAGGLCAPLETLYDVEVIGSSARPIRDALARFGVDRGGIQFRPNSSAAAAVNGAGIWTMANDVAADDPETATTKSCYVVDCPDVEEATIQAIYSCLEFSNITARFDPETTASNVRLGLIAHARLAERELYKAMAAESKLVDANPQEVGATRHILVEMDKLIAYYRDRHRLDENISLTWMAPQWVRDLMRSDIAYQMAAGDWQDAIAVADSMVAQWFTRRGVSPTWFLDGAPTQQTVNGTVIPPQVYADLAAGATIPAYPTSFDSLLYTNGSFLFLDGGTLDLGLVRDSDLNTRNRYRQFSETFEGVAFRGVEALRPVFTVEPTGTTGATVLVGDGS